MIRNSDLQLQLAVHEMGGVYFNGRLSSFHRVCFGCATCSRLKIFFFLFLVQSDFRMQFAQGLHNTECWLIKQIHTEHTHVAATNPPVHCLNQITFFSYLTWFLDRYHRCTMCGWAYLAQYSLIIEHTQGADQTWCRVRHEFYFPWHSLKTSFIKKKKTIQKQNNKIIQMVTVRGK